MYFVYDYQVLPILPSIAVSTTVYLFGYDFTVTCNPTGNTVTSIIRVHCVGVINEYIMLYDNTYLSIVQQ